MKEYVSTLGMLFPFGVNALHLSVMVSMLLLLGAAILQVGRTDFTRRREWTTHPALFWGAMGLLVFSLTLWNQVCVLVVHAGGADAQVHFDGHAVRLKAGETARFSVVWHPGREAWPVPFTSRSASGLSLRRELGGSLFLAELSGRGVLSWRETRYDARYAPRMDYQPEGAVRGGVTFLGSRLDDRVFPPGQAAPAAIPAPTGKDRVRARTFELSYAPDP